MFLPQPRFAELAPARTRFLERAALRPFRRPGVQRRRSSPPAARGIT